MVAHMRSIRIHILPGSSDMYMCRIYVADVIFYRFRSWSAHICAPTCGVSSHICGNDSTYHICNQFLLSTRQEIRKYFRLREFLEKLLLSPCICSDREICSIYAAYFSICAYVWAATLVIELFVVKEAYIQFHSTLFGLFNLGMEYG